MRRSCPGTTVYGGVVSFLNFSFFCYFLSDSISATQKILGFSLKIYMLEPSICLYSAH
jgi:hypothetical protein